MPIFHVVTEKLNHYFNRENIARMPEAQWAPGELLKVFEEMGIVQNETQAAFVLSMPDSLRAALRAVYSSAVSRESKLPVQIVWLPGYDFELTVSESPGTPDSLGGISIVVRTRYPTDPHPGARSARIEQRVGRAQA